VETRKGREIAKVGKREREEWDWLPGKAAGGIPEKRTLCRVCGGLAEGMGK